MALNIRKEMYNGGSLYSNAMKKKALFFHSTMNTPRQMTKAFYERFPEAELINIVDDSIIPEVKANGGATPGIVRRLIRYGTVAQEQGASVAVCMCTTLTNAVREASLALNIPFMMIDQTMHEKAVSMGGRIALLVTADTTMAISDAALKDTAERLNRSDVTIDTLFVPNASHALNAECDKAKHDALIAEAAMQAAQSYDVIVLAQVTMADAAALLKDCKVPVLASIKSGLEQLAEYL